MYHNIMIFQNNADEYQYMSREREKQKEKQVIYKGTEIRIISDLIEMSEFVRQWINYLKIQK